VQNTPRREARERRKEKEKEVFAKETLTHEKAFASRRPGSMFKASSSKPPFSSDCSFCKHFSNETNNKLRDLHESRHHFAFGVERQLILR